MMKGLVLELQAAAVDPITRIEDLLRLAYAAAVKLDFAEGKSLCPAFAYRAARDATDDPSLQSLATEMLKAIPAP